MRILVAALAAAFGAGCASPPQWQEIPFPLPQPAAQAWHLAEASVRGVRLRVDERLSDREEGEMVTLWETNLMPFGQGRRRRLHLRYLAGEAGQVAGFRCYVERERNEAMERSLDPRPSDWGGDGQDRELEARFRQHVLIRLGAPPREERERLRPPDRFDR